MLIGRDHRHAPKPARTQTRIGSMTEAWVNVAVGFWISYAANLVLLPLFGYPVSQAHALSLGLIFTGISIVRSYILRRVFNRLRFGHAER